jgi:hypothetical protein
VKERFEEAIRRAKATGEPVEELVGRAKTEEFIASEKAQRAELHQKLDEVLATIPLGRNRQSEHFQAIKYVIESAHNATERKRQGAWFKEKTKSS